LFSISVNINRLNNNNIIIPVVHYESRTSIRAISSFIENGLENIASAPSALAIFS